MFCLSIGKNGGRTTGFGSSLLRNKTTYEIQL